MATRKNTCQWSCLIEGSVQVIHEEHKMGRYKKLDDIIVYQSSARSKAICTCRQKHVCQHC